MQTRAAMSAYYAKRGRTRLLERSALGLNDRSLTLTNRRFALADAACKAKGENHRADQNEEFFH